ncbi:DUF6031 family protein [Rhizobium leguminosarum]|uniref:DUF6031 family protein n=1 Tax=Rhizobium leguminosarum TaxID=384 RepID=UPI003ED0D8B8
MTTRSDETTRGECKRFFEPLRIGSYGSDYAETVIEIAWLLMGEGFPIIEDIDGAENDHDLSECLKIYFAEFLLDLDQRLQVSMKRLSNHSLPVALEYGTFAIAKMSGEEFSGMLELASGCTPRETQRKLRLIWQRLLSDFPIALPDPMQAENQGAVLRAIRQWSKWCEAAGIDPSFLIPLMKAV